MDLEHENIEAEEKFFEAGGNEEVLQEAAATEEAATETVAQETETEVPEAQAEAPEAKEEAMIPHARFHAERMELQKAQAELETIKTQNQQLMQMREELNAFRQSQQQGNQAEVQQQQEEEFNNDPIGYMKNRQDLIEARQYQADQYNAQMSQTQAAIQQANAWGAQQTQEFMKEHEDYTDAYGFVESRERENIRQMNDMRSQLGQPPVNEDEQINQMTFNLIVAAANANKNPAQILYDRALAMGYARQEAKPVEESLKEKVAKIDQGQKNSQSLSDTTNNPQVNASISDISDMSDEEFDTYWKQFENEQTAAH